MTTSNDIPLFGYADRLSASPGETVEFKVSSRSEQPFEARLVRVICGDPNPDGPGVKEVPVPSNFEGSWPSRAEGCPPRLPMHGCGPPARRARR